MTERLMLDITKGDAMRLERLLEAHNNQRLAAGEEPHTLEEFAGALLRRAALKKFRTEFAGEQAA